MTICLVTNQNAIVDTVRNLQKKKKGTSQNSQYQPVFPKEEMAGRGSRRRKKKKFKLHLSVSTRLTSVFTIGL